MAISGGPDILTDGLQLHLDAADEHSYRSATSINNLVTNIGGYGYFSGNTSLGNFNAGTINISGAGGTTTNDGCVFLGTTNNFNIGNSINNGNDFTSCGWLYRTTNDSGEVLNYRNSPFRLTFDISNNWMHFYQRETVSPYTMRSIAVSVTNSLNKWDYFVVSRSGTTFSFYKNGIFVDSRTMTFTETISSTFFSIGYAWTDDDYTSAAMDGSIGPVSHYTRALSASEILQNYNATKGRYGL